MQINKKNANIKILNANAEKNIFLNKIISQK